MQYHQIVKLRSTVLQTTCVYKWCNLFQFTIIEFYFMDYHVMYVTAITICFFTTKLYFHSIWNISDEWK